MGTNRRAARHTDKVDLQYQGYGEGLYEQVGLSQINTNLIHFEYIYINTGKLLIKRERKT